MASTMKTSSTMLTSASKPMESGDEGKCLCVDDTLVYHKGEQACVSQGVGSPCGRIGQAGDYGKDPFHISCEPGLICVNSGGDSETSFCASRSQSGQDARPLLT